MADELAGERLGAELPGHGMAGRRSMSLSAVGRAVLAAAASCTLPDDDEPAAPSPVARHNAVCLETQHHVDAVNQRARHPELFPDTVLRPGEVYEEETVHVFEALGRDEGG